MVVTTNSSAISSTVRTAFPFGVQCHALTGPDNTPTPHHGLFRDDTFECVGSAVSRHYTPHTTDDVVALTECCQTVFEGGEARIDCRFHGGHYVQIVPTDSHRRAIYGSDTIWPRLLIRAGYDGRAFSCSVGCYRDACRNLLMLRQVHGTHARITHNSQLRTKMDDLISQLSVLRRGWDAFHAAALQMEQAELDIRDYMHAVYGSIDECRSARAATHHRARTEAIFRQVMRERLQLDKPQISTDWRVSAWEAYNAVQHHAQHTTRRNDSAPFARALSADNDRHVRIAGKIALEAIAA